MRHAKYRHDQNGRPEWAFWDSGRTRKIKVHQLLAISEGADPYKIFSGGDYHVHHKNGLVWDNRPENLEVLTISEHMKIHSDNTYTDEECLMWLESFVDYYGVAPNPHALTYWPGPHLAVYLKRWGSVDNALEESKVEDHKV